MKPGLELDILIAEKVMGLEVVKTKSGSKRGGYYYTIGEPNWYDIQGDMQLHNPVPNYSEDITAAWEVVTHLKAQNIHLELSPTTEGYIVNLLKFDIMQESPPWTSIATQHCKTVLEGICLAALKAINSQIETIK